MFEMQPNIWYFFNIIYGGIIGGVLHLMIKLLLIFIYVTNTRNASFQFVTNQISSVKILLTSIHIWYRNEIGTDSWSCN